ncbi:MAG TPA: glycine cleavage system protein GcvH [Vicinamibacterales bacterium]|nr:glycine cleavage system protein GcvH [Vicinamibacterales bacterium]
MLPADRKYTTSHEWVRVDGTEAQIGITDYAQRQLGDVVFVELPEVGRRLRQGEAFGVIESVKAASDLFSPMSGEVIEVNQTLRDRPQGVNTDPYGTWMIRLRVDDPGELAGLLDAAQYAELVG